MLKNALYTETKETSTCRQHGADIIPTNTSD